MVYAHKCIPQKVYSFQSDKKNIVFQMLYKRGCDAGYLPRIPGAVEVLYAIAVGYLFHIAVMEKHYLKPSYWRFLYRLTWGRWVTFSASELL